ncbi:MAG TPA: type IV toxin-antitoxin system AbiEi family antitoxin domain-containing protein [Marmoricola sp.]
MHVPDLPTRPFTTVDAHELGVTGKALRAAVREGKVRRVLRGVYLRSDQPDTVQTRAAAAALVIAARSVVRDRTAAWIHGVDVLTLPEHEILPPLETCVGRFNSPSARRGILGGTRDLAAEDVMRIDGVVVTTPLRTALDLGCHLRRRDALGALDGFMSRHGLTQEQLGTGALRFFRRRGVVQLRQLIPLADPRAESMRESWTRLEILDAGLPCPELQHWIEIDGVPVFRLDLAYPFHRVTIEYDGEDFHDRTPDQRTYDRERRAWLDEHGWTVIIVRKGDFTGAARDRWLSELRAALSPAYTNRRW